MFEETVSFEDDIIDRLDLQNSVKELDPEIQQILYAKYGAQLEKHAGYWLYGGSDVCKTHLSTYEAKKMYCFRTETSSYAIWNTNRDSNDFTGSCR